MAMGRVPVTSVERETLAPSAAAVSRPWASTVILALAYVPAVTAVLAREREPEVPAAKPVPGVTEPPPPPVGQELMQLAPLPLRQMVPTMSRVPPGTEVPMPTFPEGLMVMAVDGEFTEVPEEPEIEV